MRKSGIQKGPRTVTRWLLVLFVVGLCSRGGGFYNQTLKVSPQLWMAVIHGTANAPEQYRVGIVLPSYWLAQHLAWHGRGLPLSWIFAAFDLVGGLVAVLLLHGLLEKTQTYRQASLAAQWFGSAGFVALALYALDWTLWYQKVGTLPSAGIVALMAWLWSPPANEARSTTVRRTATLSVTLLALVGLQSLIRADLALTMCLGVSVASALGLSPRLSLPRGAALTTSTLGMLLAAGIQLYLSRVLYPHASYGGVPVFMLLHDYRQIVLWVSCLVFAAPFLWTTAQVLRQKSWGDGASGALLLAALFHFVMWITMGRLDEVRIFLPMALLTLPLTLEMAMRHLALIPVNAQIPN